jgi:chemotaxis protein methyltransferase CheR
VFGHLSEFVIPQLLAHSARPRVWSAACSDGSELYSVAMLLAARQPLAECRLLGSDYRARAINIASNSVYPAEATAAVPAELAGRFLVRDHCSVTVTDDLRAAIQWQTRDLLTGSLPHPWDLILCRNLAIYLSSMAADSLWHRLYSALAPGAFLVVGRAEKPQLPGLKCVAPCIYRKAS